MITSSLLRTVTLCCLLGYLASTAQAQPFTFADTHPINNPDSLEQWLRANPTAPALIRLRNVVTLENTYLWGYQDMLGRTVSTAEKLHRQLQTPRSRAAYLFVQTLAQRRSNPAGVSQYALAFLDACKSLRDTTGMVQAYCILVNNATQNYGNGAKSGSSFFREYLATARTLAFGSNNRHAQLLWTYTAGITTYAPALAQQQPGNMRDTLKTRVAEGFALIKQSRGGFNYAVFNFSLLRSISYQMDGKTTDALAINETLLSTLRPRQATNRLSLLYNLGTGHYYLKNYPKATTFFEQAVAVMEHDTLLTMKPFPPLYYNYAATSLEAGNYKKAAVLYDSAYQQLRTEQRVLNEKSRLNQESRYQLRERQQENALLRQKQQAAEYQNWVFTIALAASVLVALIIAFLAFRLLQNRNKVRRANAQLTQLLHEREQTNTQLSTALTEVQQFNKAREHFIGIIAHDMRKPLISFRGLAALVSTLLQQKAYEDIQEVSKTIDSAGLDLETMFDNLLKWALAQRETIPYHPESVLLTGTLRNVVGLFQQLVHFQQTSISLTCPDSLRVWADPNGLELIARNLIDNALKHIYTTGQIMISCSQEPTGRVQIQITDTGEGIAPAQLAFLQSVFAGQVQGEVGQNGLGLGLGLLLVRDFTVRNQGTLAVESTIGKGTSFTLTFPAE